MGVFDLPAPLLGALDKVMEPLPGWLRLVVWALLTVAVTVMVYRFCITRIRSRQRTPLKAGAIVLSALPALTILVYLNNHYRFHYPAAGGYMHGHTTPRIPLADLNTVALDPERVFLVNYPVEGETSAVVAANGEKLLDLPMQAPVPMVAKKHWWNVFFGNPNGYLPDDYEIESLHLTLPGRSYLPFGPDWLRGWQFVYLAAVIVATIAARLIFRAR